MEFEDYIEFDKIDEIEPTPTDVTEEEGTLEVVNDPILDDDHPTNEDDLDPEELKVYYLRAGNIAMQTLFSEDLMRLSESSKNCELVTTASPVFNP